MLNKCFVPWPGQDITGFDRPQDNFSLDIHLSINSRIDLPLWDTHYPIRLFVNTKLRTMEEWSC